MYCTSSHSAPWKTTRLSHSLHLDGARSFLSLWVWEALDIWAFLKGPGELAVSVTISARPENPIQRWGNMPDRWLPVPVTETTEPLWGQLRSLCSSHVTTYILIWLTNNYFRPKFRNMMKDMIIGYENRIGMGTSTYFKMPLGIISSCDEKHRDYIWCITLLHYHAHNYSSIHKKRLQNEVR